MQINFDSEWRVLQGKEIKSMWLAQNLFSVSSNGHHAVLMPDQRKKSLSLVM